MSGPSPGPAAGAPVDREPAAPPGRAGRRLALLMLVPALVFALALFVYPFSYGIGLTFQPTPAMQQQWGGGIFANYVAFFSDPFVFDSVGITMRLALPAALFNVLASIPVAYQLRHRFRGKRLLTSLLVLPITLGTVLTAQGLLIFAGRQGWINRVPARVRPDRRAARLREQLLGRHVLPGHLRLPVRVPAHLVLPVGHRPVRSRRPRRRWAPTGVQRFRRVILPLLAPGLATTFILTFVLAFSVFPSARLVGDAMGETRVMSLMAFRAFGEQNDYPMASTIALMMGAVELVVVAIVLAVAVVLYKGSTGGKG